MENLAFELPPVINTGNPSAIPILVENDIYLDEQKLTIANGASIITFFELEGVYHICGERSYVNAAMNMIAFGGQENIPGEEPIVKGIPHMGKVRFAIVYNNALYEIVPRSIMGLDMTTYKFTKPLDEIIARGFELVHVRNFDMIDTPIEVFPAPYLQWLVYQCPQFNSPMGEYDFDANIITHSIQSSPTIGKVKRYRLHNKREMTINMVGVKYATGRYIEAEEADGQVEWTGYRWIYKFAPADYERGFVTFRQYASRQPFCGLQSDPFIIIKANLIMLPASVLPPDEVLEPPAPPPPPVVIPDVPEGFEVIAGNEYFSICITPAGFIAFVNHLNHSISVQLKEKGASRWILGMGVRANQTNVRDRLPFGHDRYKGKTYEIRFSSFRAGIYPAITLEFDW